MKREIERYLPLPLLLWRTATQPFWDGLAWLVDLLLRIKLRQMEVSTLFQKLNVVGGVMRDDRQRRSEAGTWVFHLGSDNDDILGSSV